jgi:Zn-dependent peptidase ImmA (M78 family)/transcriptional regulator with XRE-family HTH domain
MGFMPTTPDRVRDLIQASGLSQGDFALRVGLNDSKLSKSLSGARRFSSLDLARIAEVCEVTVDWLITGDEPPLALAARTTGGSAGAAVSLAKRYSTLRSDMAAIGYPQPWQPVNNRSGTGTWTDQGRKLAEAALEKLRKAGRSLVQGSLPALVEDVFGADVAIAELGPDFDGLATSTDEVKLIVLATSHVAARQRFTLAHELGHLLAGDDQGLHLDRDVFDKAQSKDPTEARANAFAASFLMPEEHLRTTVGSTGLTEAAFADLACDLMVTPSALAYRLLNLRLIDAGTCDRYKTLTAARAASMTGRSEEFARHVAEAKTPRPPGLLVRDTYAAYDSGSTTLRPYANLMGVDVETLRDALEAESEVSDFS